MSGVFGVPVVQSEFVRQLSKISFAKAVVAFSWIRMRKTAGEVIARLTSGANIIPEFSLFAPSC